MSQHDLQVCAGICKFMLAGLLPGSSRYEMSFPSNEGILYDH